MTPFDIHRGGLPPETPCPSDLELARFVEGKVSGSARALMVGHLAECDDCREVVATVVAAQEVETHGDPVPAPLAPPAAVAVPTARPWLHAPSTWAAALAVAAMAVIVVRVVSGPTGAPGPEPEASVWADVAEVVGPSRTIEARLSGLDAHVPLQPPTRAAAADAGFAAQALAARLTEKAALPTADPAARRAARHAAAVATLVAGRPDAAAAMLEAALADAPAGTPGRADLLADLAAARAEVAEAATRDHWNAALDAADQALAADATHVAARFNRALALERLDRRDDAVQAWRALAGDARLSAGWRDEAAAHVRALVP